MKTIAKTWLVLSSLVSLLLLACGGPDVDENLGEEQLALTAPTQVPSFVFLATGRLTFQDRTQVTGGNIGVAGGAVNGQNSITTGLDSRIGVGNGMIGRRIVLNQRTAVGDLFVTQLVPQGGTFTSQSAFSTPPVPPPIPAFTAGTTALTVNSGQTVTLAAANRGQVTVNGTLRLSGGTYQFQNLTIGPGGIVQPTAASLVRVAGRVSASDRARIVPVTGLNASALRLFVNGANDTNGGVVFGNDAQLTGLVVSRASFSAGARFIGSGAIGASNISFGSDLRFTFNTGFGCNANSGCNDSNDCTSDACTDARCVNTALANGTACAADGNTCTNDRCTNGACAHPPVANGTACTLPNATASCTAGTCSLVGCNAGFGDCDVDPATGCETGVLSDESNCGQCGAACFVQNGVAACANGACTDDIIQCFGDFDDCDLDPENGCEANLAGDESNCGQCGAACFVENGVAACADFQCTDDVIQCFGGWEDCDGDGTNGCETDITRDPGNCGACGVNCNVNGNGICANSLCQVTSCEPTFDNCDNDGSNGCEADLVAPTSCGECGNVCRLGGEEPFCAGEQCTCTIGTLGVPGSCATCQDQHAVVVKNSRTVTLTGFASGPLEAVVVSALKDQTRNPADCAVQQDNSLWQDLTPNGLSSANIAFTRASPFPEFPRLNFYQWTLTLTVPDTLWPEGGLVRLRIIGPPAYEDEPSVVAQDPTQSCVAKEPEVKFTIAQLVDRCAGASIFKTCPNQIGTRQIVTLVDPSPTPGQANKVQGKTCTPTQGGVGTPKDLGHFLNIMEPDLSNATPVKCNFDDCGPGKGCEADKYYAAVDPLGERATFPGWLAKNPLLTGTTEIGAKYYNTGDLGVGRDMHCWFTTVGAACYVSNYGAAFVGNPPATQEEALQQVIHHQDQIPPLPAVATVAMEWIDNPVSHENEVQFFTYDGAGQRINKVQLDSEGEKPVPGNCITCHGGTYDTVTHKVKNANFLPFDTCSFAFSSEHGFTLADQQDDFKQLNLLVWITQPENREGGGITEFLEGVYRDGNQIFGRDTLDEAWVPSIWQASLAQEQVYLDVVKPNCRACHLSRLAGPAKRPLNQTLVQLAAGQYGCAPNFHLMPHAERTQERFWNSSARAELINAMNEGNLVAPAGGGCAP